MPHSNGRIYIDTSGTTPVGISIADIQQTLGSGKNDIGGLIRSGKVKWAPKYKPVRYPSVGATYESVPTLYRDADNKCGIEIPVLTASDFASANIQSIITGAADYSYIAPRGKNTNSEWFRLRDFNGYNHNESITFQFVPPTVSSPGRININGEHVFTLRFGNLYTKTNTVSASVLSLVDLMMRFSDSGGNLYVYNSKNPQSWSASNDITNDLSYGFLGIIIIYTSTVGSVPSVQVCMRSHSLGIHSADNNELEIDFTAVYDETGVAPNPQNGDVVFLAPCFTNLNTEGEWVALISGTSYSQIKCGLFPKFPAASSSVNYVSYTLYTPPVVLATLSYSLQGATLISGISYKVSYSSASYVAVSVTAGTGTLGENNTCRITNVNSSYSGAVGNSITINLTFTSRVANFQIMLKDSNNHSIFIADYIPIQLQILSPNGEYQNDTIQIFSYNA